MVAKVLEKGKQVLGTATRFHKLSKISAGYIEVAAFKRSDLHGGYFCYSCTYFANVSGGRCAIVDHRGADTDGHRSNVIAPHGCCNLWDPNWKEIEERKPALRANQKPGGRGRSKAK